VLAVSNVAVFDPQRIVESFARHRVRYVLIGALAARLQGFPRVTADADLTPSSDSRNCRSLADILRSKEAAGRPQDHQDVIVIREMLRRRGTR